MRSESRDARTKRQSLSRRLSGKQNVRAERLYSVIGNKGCKEVKKSTLCTSYIVLRTTIHPSSFPSLLRLNSRNHYGIEDIIYSAASAEVVDGFVETLEHGANSHCSSFPLDGFVGIVSRVQIREY